MKHALAAVLLAAVAVPAAAAPPKDDKSSAAEAKEAFDLSAMMAMFDKMFPAGPEPTPARLALARTTAAGMLPDGVYAGLFDELMSGMVERVLSITPGDFGAKPKAAGAKTLRQELASDDPHFDARMKIAQRVIREELVKLSTVLEPKLRDGLARSIARRLDERQLADTNAFLATPSGKAFAGQSMRMWVDPDVMRSVMQTVPDMITAMPGAMARLEAETKHLPKPKKAKAEPEEADEAADETS